MCRENNRFDLDAIPSSPARRPPPPPVGDRRRPGGAPAGGAGEGFPGRAVDQDGKYILRALKYV